MISNNLHIVSSLKWNTSFDRKERASELQERLSGWSKIPVHKIFNEVFSRFCPPDQTWRIDSLDLDLGEIHSDELEAELERRLRIHLTEKLTDLLWSPRAANAAGVEIIEHEVSQVGMLSSFLLTGVLPWNHERKLGSPEEMMLHQLRHNERAIAEMLWTTGAVHENVRRRMAWQFSEPVVKGIIRALEPNNHEEIIGLTEEIVTVQKKETVVKGNTDSFRRDLWLWVLNYLFDERGSVYNRIAFMKSTLRQMAAHYNMRYEDLLELVIQAAEKISLHRKMQAGFLQTVMALTSERREEQQQHANASSAEDWSRLVVLFDDKAAHSAVQGRAELNDLVTYFSRTDRARLAKFLRDKGERFILELIPVLTEVAREEIVFALAPSKAEVILHSMELVTELCAQAGLTDLRNEVWQAAVSFAYRKDSPAAEQFAAWSIAALIEKKKIRESHFTVLLAALYRGAVNRATSPEVHRRIAEQLLALGQEQGAVHFDRRELEQLLDHFTEALHTGDTVDVQLPVFQQQVVAALRLNRKMAAAVLLHWARKAQGAAVLTELLAEEDIRLLVEYNTPGLYRVVIAVEKTAAEIKQSSAQFPGPRLWTFVAEAIISYPSLSIVRLLAMIAEEFMAQQYLTHSEVRLLFETLADKNIPGVDGRVLEKLAERFDTTGIAVATSFSPAQQTVWMLRIQRIMRRSKHAQLQVARMLSQLITQPFFVTWRKNSTTEAEVILNYLLPEGASLLDSLTEQYRMILLAAGVNRRESELTVMLHEMYWQCIAAVKSHKGNATAVQRLFRLAVQAKFGTVTQQEIESALRSDLPLTRSAEKTYVLRNGTRLTMERLFFYIEKCLREGVDRVEESMGTYVFSEMLTLGLNLKPSAIRRIMHNVPYSERRRSLLEEAVSFHYFSMWILGDRGAQLNRVPELMRLFVDAIEVISPGTGVDRLVQEYWKQLWQLVVRGSWSEEEMKQLIRSSFTTMAHDMDIHIEELVEAVRNKEIRIAAPLRAEMIACFPALAALPEQESLPAVDKELEELEQKGLLDELCFVLVTQQQVPQWLSAAVHHTPEELLARAAVEYPLHFLRAVKNTVMSSERVQWLATAVDFSELATTIGFLHRDKQTLTTMLSALYNAFEKIAGASGKQLREVLFRKLLTAWTDNSWKLISTTGIWNELLWDMYTQHNVSQSAFVALMRKVKAQLPPALQLSLDQFIEQRGPKKAAPRPATGAPKKKQMTRTSIPLTKTEPVAISVRNAGVVLLSHYVQMLFERLALVKEGKFVTPEAQNDAVHYLQYVVTGLTKTDESLLPLNKVVCGLPVDHPVTDGITITDDQKKLVDGLIKAAISHWPAIGECSIDGFRGNWLVRDGMLSHREDKWELVVEKRPYDVLIHKSPFSFSIIRYPWMEKPMYVTWPY